MEKNVKMRQSNCEYLTKSYLIVNEYISAKLAGIIKMWQLNMKVNKNRLFLGNSS